MSMKRVVIPTVGYNQKEMAKTNKAHISVTKYGLLYKLPKQKNDQAINNQLFLIFIAYINVDTFCWNNASIISNCNCIKIIITEL